MLHAEYYHMAVLTAQLADMWTTEADQVELLLKAGDTTWLHHASEENTASVLESMARNLETINAAAHRIAAMLAEARREHISKGS